MCGIAAFVGSDLDAARRFVARANGLLAHRGPDDEGVLVEPGIALAHRRLSIVDLTAAGHQPMTSADGRYTIVYNGEIYNHEALRPKLAKRWNFTTRSDTETLLAALALDGPAALETLVGMWALALWDRAEQRLLLCRDRYGQKPLHWRIASDGSLRFSSEIAPLLEPGEAPKAYAPALAEFIAIGNYGHLGERTFFRDIYSFKPGHYASVEPGARSFEQCSYWRFPAISRGDLRPYDDVAKRQFRHAFDDAVTSQLMSDVPLAATLSGGLDSTAIVGAMVANANGGRIRAFTAQAEGSAYDESRYVKAVGEKWGSKLEIETLQIEQMPLSVLTPEVIRTQEEPFGDPSIIAHYMIARAVRKAGIRVLLGGQGGDELLLGYPYMSQAVIASQLRAGHAPFAMRELMSLGQGYRTTLRILASAAWPGLEEAARARARVGQYHVLSQTLQAAALDEAPRFAPISDLAGFWLDSIERLALPHLVHYDDRNGMRFALEGRMPFLDHRLADVVTGIDPTGFLAQGQRKNLLRDACGDLMPDAVRARKDKIGFHTPSGRLLREEAAWVRETVCGEAAQALGLFDGKAMQEYCTALESPGASAVATGTLWRAIAAAVWAKTFNVDCDFAARTLKASKQALPNAEMPL